MMLLRTAFQKLTVSLLMTFAALARKFPPGHQARFVLFKLDASPLAINSDQ